MLNGVPGRSSVVPLDAILDVAGPTNVMSRWIALTAEDVHESTGFQEVRLRPSMARLACRRATRADLAEARRQASEGWLGRRDSNPNTRVQSAVSYR